MRGSNELGVLEVTPSDGSILQWQTRFHIGENYGLAACKSSSGKLFVVVSTKSGVMKQFELDVGSLKPQLNIFNK